MKGMKKAIALALSAVLLCATVLVNNVVSVKAAPSAEFEVVPSTTDVKQGAEFTVTMKINSNSEGVAGFAGKLYFNKDKMTIKDYNEMAAYMNFRFAMTVKGPDEGANDVGYLGFSVAEAKRSTATGELITVTFVVKEDAVLGEDDIRLDIESISGGEKGTVGFEATVKSTKVNVVSSCDHVLDNGTVTKPATCSEKGTKTFKCTICGKDVKTEEIDMIPHTKDAGTVTTDPTCQKEGVKSFKCTVCKQDLGSESNEAVPKVDHKKDNGTVTKDPTCKEEGVKTFKCVWCEVELDTEKIDKTTTHTKNEGTVTTPATCTTAGVKTFKCSVCGTDMGTEPVAALGHDMNEGVQTKAPTCTEKGVLTKSCKRDGCTYTETSDIAALGHDMNEGVQTKAPTCTEKGVLTKSCKRDGCTYTETSDIAALGHKFDNGTVTTPATCTAEGVKTYKCQNAGCTETKTEPVAALGHKFDNGTVTTPATCTAEGVKTYKCQNAGCTETKTEKVEKIAHVADNGEVTTQPTCTEAGVKTYKCVSCKEVLSTEPVEALGHNFGEFVVVKEPTEKEEGLMKATCARCGLVKEAKIPVLPVTEMIDMNTGMPAASEYPLGSDIGVLIPEIGVPASPAVGDVCYVPTMVNGAPYTADTKLDTSKAGALEVNVVYTANVFDGKNWVSTGVNKETKITVNIVAPKENTEEPKKETNPNTGDSTNIALLLSILAASAATVVVASRKRKDA